jgi:threonine dehydratase
VIHALFRQPWAAVALAARLRGIPAYVVMPENAPDIKKTAVAGYGAQITFFTSAPNAREITCGRIIEETGATFLHPSNEFSGDLRPGYGRARIM